MHPILKQNTSLALYLLGWALMGVLVAVVIAGTNPDLWPVATALAVPLTLVYAFICLAAWYVCLANPLPRTPIGRVVASQLAGGLLSTGLWLLIAQMWARLLTRLPHLAQADELFVDHQLLLLAAGILFYLLAATFNYLLLAFEASRRSRQEALELEVLAREAELQAFRNQIDPHFLFNCLNSISSLCGSDPAAARHTAVRLGDFLRASLRLGSNDTIPLSEELRLCSAYLDVERVRFGERLDYHQEIDDACLPVELPALLLQPLLENALKHGVAHLVDGGEVRLRCEPQGDDLLIAVSNACDPGRPRKSGTGIGLSNVRKRLKLRYDSEARMEVVEESSSFEVRIRLPAKASQAPLEVAHG